MLSAAEVAAIRSAIPALHGRIYLNTGTLGPSPRPVTEAFLRAYTAWQEEGPGDPDRYHARRADQEAARADLAALLGCTPAELALTHNVSDALNLVFAGLPWRSGDEVVISDEEHPAVYVPALHLQRLGVRVRIAPWLQVADAIGPRTRLVCQSHVSSMTGAVADVAAVVAAARASGALVCLDGAQAVGQIPVDVAALGCDFYAFNAHKWLLAPVGSAGLVVRSGALDALTPVFVGAGSAEVAYAAGAALRLAPDASRFEYGTRNWAVADGIRAAVAFARGSGIDRIAARGRALSARLAAAAAAVPGATVLGGGETGIVSVRLAGVDAEVVRRHLAAAAIVTRTVRERDAVRFSCAYFNTEDEVHAAVAALATVRR